MNTVAVQTILQIKLWVPTIGGLAYFCIFPSFCWTLKKFWFLAHSNYMKVAVCLFLPKERNEEKG